MLEYDLCDFSSRCDVTVLLKCKMSRNYSNLKIQKQDAKEEMFLTVKKTTVKPLLLSPCFIRRLGNLAEDDKITTNENSHLN